MATVEELIRQYDTDPELKNHDVEVSLADFPKIIEEAKKAGLIK